LYQGKKKEKKKVVPGRGVRGRKQQRAQVLFFLWALLPQVQKKRDEDVVRIVPGPKKGA
jgi:hypothetical protein